MESQPRGPRLSPKNRAAGSAAARAISRSRPSPQQRGTSIILHLREDAEEYLNAWKLKQVIAKYRPHQLLPILMEKEEWKDGEKQINPNDENGGFPGPGGMGRRASGKPSAKRQRPVDAPQQRHHGKNSTPIFYKTISHDHEALP